MRKFNLLLSLVIVISCGCNDMEKEVEETQKIERINASIVNNPNTATGEIKKGLVPILTFEKLRHNFGDVVQGQSVSYQFAFVNTGESDLIISNAKGSCGCTVPEWPKKAIAPGEEAKIKVTFNSNGREGKQQKNVTLVTNAIPNTTVLKITGNVVVPEK